jgi:hypothetical protein
VIWPFKKNSTGENQPDPLAEAVIKAERRLQQAAEQGIDIPEAIVTPILSARDALRNGTAEQTVRAAFYQAYRGLIELTRSLRLGKAGDPFETALNDAEQLLIYAAEMSIQVPQDVAAAILTARTAFADNKLTDKIRGDFYDGYTKLAALFGDATVETIRNCSSRSTRWTLARNRIMAVGVTLVIATASVIIFVTDDMAKRIGADVTSANGYAATLRAGLTVGSKEDSIDPKYATEDPCQLTDKPPESDARQIRNVDDVTQLQQFAVTIRDLHSRALKLNTAIMRIECDPYGGQPCRDDRAPVPDPAQVNKELQLNPTILNYTAEVLCKIRTYQKVRSFATNVQNDYTAAVGAVAAYALPIFYALLGAYAYRLRLFGETIRKRTYHPSFADSARMITAVIAGAIVSLFYPAQGASFSPLATAFLIGYGVELFFKFLDINIGAFGSGSFPGQRPR